jgi:hypothetical protein
MLSGITAIVIFLSGCCSQFYGTTPVNYFDLKSGSFGTSNKLKKQELGVE